jgi:hypothetical protein
MFELTEATALNNEELKKTFEKITAFAAVPSFDLQWFLLSESRESTGASVTRGRVREQLDQAWTTLRHLAIKALPIVSGSEFGPKLGEPMIFTPEELRKEELDLMTRVTPGIAHYALHPHIAPREFLEAHLQSLGEAIATLAVALEGVFIRAVEPMRDLFLRERPKTRGRAVALTAQEREFPEPKEYVQPSERPVPEHSGAPAFFKSMLLVLSSEVGQYDPEAAITVAGTVAQSGDLSWDQFLAIVNSRCWCHKFIDQFGPEDLLRVRICIIPSGPSSFGLGYSVVEQPLGQEFKDHFVRQNLAGKLAMLWHFIEWAKEVHATIVQISEGSVEAQLTARAKTLFERIQRSTMLSSSL